MASLTAIFGNTPDKDDDDANESERLLNLYWNRAELKKEFAELQAEKFRLQERIKEHEGSAARVEQKLEHLENLLLDPEWVYNVVTYFQLQGLNLRCQAKLAKFAEELKQQREQKQHGQLLQDWNERRAAEAAEIEHQIGEQRMQLQMLEDGLQAEQHRLATMSGLVKIFRRRSVKAALDNIVDRIETAQAEEEGLLQYYDEIEKRIPPDTQGLDIATKRMINFMILAYAQQLYLHFKDDDIAGMAKEAGEKSVGAINYGDKKACDIILDRVRKRIEALEKMSDSADLLRQRAKLIAEKALFRSESDAVPVSDTVSAVYAIDAQGGVKETDANLLRQNYWNLAEIVSR